MSVVLVCDVLSYSDRVCVMCVFKCVIKTFFGVFRELKICKALIIAYTPCNIAIGLSLKDITNIQSANYDTSSPLHVTGVK